MSEFDISKSILEELYYEKRMTQAKIAEYFGCSRMTISNRMRAYGMETRINSDYLRIALPYEELYRLYIEQQLTTIAIAARLNCTPSTVSRRLRVYKIPARLGTGHGCGSPTRQYVPSEVLASWDSLLNGGVVTDLATGLAYVMGLLASDGNLPKGKNEVSMTSTEIEIINHYRTCLHMEPSIEPYYKKGKGNCKPQYTIGVTDRAFRAFSERIGLIPAKSKTLGPLAIPDSIFADFVRGAWDGDGWWSIAPRKRTRGYLRAGLASGSPVYLAWVQINVERLIGLHGSIYGAQLMYNGHKAVMLGYWMYHVSPFELPPAQPAMPSLSYKYDIWRQFAG